MFESIANYFADWSWTMTGWTAFFFLVTVSLACRDGWCNPHKIIILGVWLFVNTPLPTQFEWLALSFVWVAIGAIITTPLSTYLNFLKDAMTGQIKW